MIMVRWHAATYRYQEGIGLAESPSIFFTVAYMVFFLVSWVSDTIAYRFCVAVLFATNQGTDLFINMQPRRDGKGPL